MTWHLKDRELEKKLIAIDPNFVKTLTDTVEENLNQPNGWFDDESITEVELTYNGDYLGTVNFFTYELEEVPEYNPHGWNNFPEVTPPEGELLRVELFNLMLRKITRACAIYCNETWYAELNGEPNGTLELAGMTRVKRFRPWD